MQKNDIIKQFAETIKESSIHVEGDPVLLTKIFEAMDKKKKRKIILNIFLIAGFSLIALTAIILGLSTPMNRPTNSKSMSKVSKNNVPEVSNSTNIVVDTEVKKDNSTIKKSDKKVSKKQSDNFNNVVSYRFNNHQVDVFKNGSEEFMQINVFGADGVEQDVLKIMEDLKKSYSNNEVYVDSVKRQ